MNLKQETAELILKTEWCHAIKTESLNDTADQIDTLYRNKMLEVIEGTYKSIPYVKGPNMGWKEQTDLYCKGREDVREELRQAIDNIGKDK